LLAVLIEVLMLAVLISVLIIRKADGKSFSLLQTVRLKSRTHQAFYSVSKAGGA